MRIVCPKCGVARTAQAEVPDWQCPSCGVCYAKVGKSEPGRAARAARESARESTLSGVPWMKWLLFAAIGWGTWVGLHHTTGVKSDYSETELRAIAARVQPGDVVMYSTSECIYCVRAKQWLTEYGFAFKECNMSLSQQCEREFQSYGADGTPFLVVRGHQMKEGFDGREFLAALQ